MNCPDASPPRCGWSIPPGIATIVPGERLDERAQPMIDYLKVFERGANLFPGFENEIQGVYREKAAGWVVADLYLCDVVAVADLPGSLQ